MTKKLTNLSAFLAAFAILALTACNSDSDDGGNSSGSAGTAAGTPEPADIGGTSINVNPMVTFTGTDTGTFYYENNESNDYPSGSQNGSYTVQKINNGLEIELNFDDATIADEVELELTDFRDVDGTGYIGQATVRVNFGEISDQATAYFDPGSLADPDADAEDVADLSGAPTEEEFSNLENRVIVFESVDGVEGLAFIESDSTLRLVEDHGTAIYEYEGTYEYTNTGENTGDFTYAVSGDFEYSAEDGGTESYTETVDGEVELTFETWFVGNYAGTETEEYSSDSGEPTSLSESVSGTFRVMDSAVFE